MCMDLRVWNPVPPDWESSVVSVRGSLPQKVSCLQWLIVLVLNFDVLLRRVLAVYRHTPHFVWSI